MLLGAGYEPPQVPQASRPPKGLSRDERYASRLQRWRDNAQQRAPGRQKNVYGVGPRVGGSVDRRKSGFYVPPQGERSERVKKLMAQQRGASSTLGSPRCQDPTYGSWTYRDRTLARYQNYPPGRDVPDPRRPMARTQELMIGLRPHTFLEYVARSCGQMQDG